MAGSKVDLKAHHVTALTNLIRRSLNSKMSTLETHYRFVYNVYNLHAKSEAGQPVIIEARQEIHSTSTNTDAKTRHTFLRVTGTIKDKDRTYSDSWDFSWPDSDVQRLEIALMAIKDLFQHNPSAVQVEMEVYSDVYEWLRVGGIGKEKTRHCYVEFTKDGSRLRANFETYESLVDLRDIINQCINA